MRLLACAAISALVFCAKGAPAAGVEFPGPLPGEPRASENRGRFTLQNAVIAATWEVKGATLRPALLRDQLAGQEYGQSGTELFRLALEPASVQSVGTRVAVHLLNDRIVALASKDGAAWMELASFPRADFPGDPKLVRLGKMNLKAQALDNPGDLGAAGACTITELEPALMTSNRFVFRGLAHQAAITECPFPAGLRSIACRIDKDTDQGMSWGPALALIWEEGRRFLLVGVREKAPVFNLTTAAGEKILSASLASYPAAGTPASGFRLTGTPRLIRLPAAPTALRMGERFAGRALEAGFTNEAGLHARWRAELREGANYLHQTLELSSPQAAIPLFGVELTDVRVPMPTAIGTVPGCPVTGGQLFFGVEMPGAQNALDPAGVRIGFACKLAVSPAQPYSFGAVTGVAPANQLRRAFLYYVERERARPSKPFLHYNCWYDLGFGVDQKGLLDVAARFNEELVVKRGVPVLSYLADDGWDDPAKGLWVENRNKFPEGFKGLADRMARTGAHLGIWISPLGGYGGDKERTAQARKMGLIPETASLDLSYPAYKRWFQDRCRQLMREAGVNVFKWDRAGDGVSPHFMALLDVARNLRQENPDLFVNVTVGTWPSPFWLNHVDCTWRNGTGDVGWSGKGNDPAHEKYNRERWLTFRDGSCYRMFVQASPLYPLNSCMHHGIVHGREFQGGSIGQSNPPDLKHEARSYFANGAMLQELYLTPSLMTAEAWDQVAEAARWAHANAKILVDAHWVGGDPQKLEPYGYAAWNHGQGTLMLRNPDDRPRTIDLDAAVIFELPVGAPQHYTLVSPYKDQRVQNQRLNANQPQTITLDPFEVLVFDARKN